MWLRGGLARGYGGRLGALAAVASFLFIGLAPLLGAEGELFPIARRGVLEQGLGAAATTFVVCTAGMLATMAALGWAPVAGSRRAVRIFVAAAVAFAGLVMLQQFMPGDASDLDAYYAGCFIGMSSPRRLRSPLQAMAAAVLLTALLILTGPILPSVGGSLGYIAFVSVIFVDAAVRLFVEAGESPWQTVLAWTRGLVAALAIFGVLLSSELMFQRPVAEPGGPFVDAGRALAPVRTTLPIPDEERRDGIARGEPAAAVAAASELPLQILDPGGANPLAARRPSEPTPDAAFPNSAEPSRRITRYGQAAGIQTPPLKRNQLRGVPHATPRPRVAARYELQPAPEWQPDPSTLAGP